MTPIWDRNPIYLGDKDSEQYNVYINDALVYTGKAYKKPGDNDVYVCVNDIVADYLSQYEVADDGYIGTPIVCNVKVTSPDISDYTGKYYYDWSYDFGFNPNLSGQLLNFPVTGEVDNRQKITLTKIYNDNIHVHLVFKDGMELDFDYPRVQGADFNNDFNNDFAIARSEEDEMTNFTFKLSEFPNLKSITIDNVLHYDVVDTCCKYCIYYVNDYGGWDSLLVKGEAITADSYERKMKNAEMPEYGYQFGSVIMQGGVTQSHNFLNKIVRSYELNTGWIKGNGGERMHNLFNSTFCYLYDLANGQTRRINITDTSCKYRNFRNEGNTPVFYTINAEDAIRFERK